MRAGIRYGATPLIAAGILAAGPALAADNRDNLDSTILVQQAAEAVAAMKTNPDAAALLAGAQGVYVVPDFAEGAVIVGGAGGDGVLVSQEGGTWMGPAFYDVAQVTAGAQLGFTAGPVVMLLMSDQAVNSFKTGNGLSLEASADLTVVDFSAHEQVSTDGSDVVIWTNTQGLFAGLTATASDITWDEDANNGYYGQEVTPEQALAHSGDDPLTQALAQ